MERPSWLEICEESIASNIAVLNSAVGGRIRIGHVIKAGGYGLGASILLEASQRCGVTDFSVFGPDQALAARSQLKGSSRIVILRPEMMPGIPAKWLDELARDVRIQWTLHDDSDVESMMRLADAVGRPLSVHLEVDTGMNRGGCAISDAPRIAGEILASESLELVGICTHLATADSSQEEAVMQRDRLAALTHEMQVSEIHVENSHGVLGPSNGMGDLARVGLAVLGYVSFSGDAAGPDQFSAGLKPVVEWKSRICAIRKVGRGEKVGYGMVWESNRVSVLGVVPVGYADGLPTRLSIGFKVGVDVGGRTVFCDIVGGVNMDQFLLDLTDVADEVRPGSVVVIYSASRDAPNSLESAAKISGHLVYELLCRVGPRVDRVLLKRN